MKTHTRTTRTTHTNGFLCTRVLPDITYHWELTKRSLYLPRRSQSPARSEYSSMSDMDDNNDGDDYGESEDGLETDEEEGYDLGFLLGEV